MRRHTPRQRLLGYLLALRLMAAPAQLLACVVCVGLPEKTATDHIIDAECVILARHHAGDRFAYAARTVLKGAHRGEPIDLLVDSVIRRAFESDEDRHVVLVRGSGDGPWRSLGLASKDYETVIRRLAVLSDSWRGEEGVRARLRFFFLLLGHEDLQVRELAYLELGRAPYSMIQRMGRAVPYECYAPMLTERRYLQWRSLAILLHAQSESPTDKRRITDAFHTAERLGITTNLAAWAAAAIEVDAESSIGFIEDSYFRRHDRTPDEIEAVLKAISMHGSEKSGVLRERIITGYGVLLEHHPGFATRVAEDMRNWGRPGRDKNSSAPPRRDAPLQTAGAPRPSGGVDE